VFGSSAVTVTTKAGPDGSYQLVLPGEVPNRTVSAAQILRARP
jgi:hypothetical protein